MSYVYKCSRASCWASEGVCHEENVKRTGGGAGSTIGVESETFRVYGTPPHSVHNNKNIQTEQQHNQHHHNHNWASWQKLNERKSCTVQRRRYLEPPNPSKTQQKRTPIWGFFVPYPQTLLQNNNNYSNMSFFFVVFKAKHRHHHHHHHNYYYLKSHHPYVSRPVVKVECNYSQLLLRSQKDP